MLRIRALLAEWVSHGVLFHRRWNWGVPGTKGLPARDLAIVGLTYSFLGSQDCFKKAYGAFPAKGLFSPSLPLYSPCKVKPSMMELSIPSPHAGVPPKTQDQWKNEVTRCLVAGGSRVNLQVRDCASQSSISYYGNKKKYIEKLLNKNSLF